ncbi:MAG: hypothetical protein KAS32_03425, partial [Candidatus Peribacteraceae bacterium]|nr:hypothetical protein [Candidatus Peribacteraceae bacterium]
MKTLDAELFNLLTRTPKTRPDSQFNTRTLGDGTICVDVPGFDKDDLVTILDEECLDCHFENDQSTMSFRVGLPKNTEGINITVD